MSCLPPPPPLAGVRVVLVEPAVHGNIGATARVMKNTGLADLALVHAGDWDSDETRRLAHGAGDILDACRTFPDLASAVADCHLVVGTTHRPGRQRQAIYGPERAIERILPLGGRRVALVFGRERDGLWQEELRLCHLLVRFPAAVSHPSFNLSHAVLLLAHSLFVAAGTPGAEAARPPAELATHAEREHLLGRLQEALDRIGFSHYNGDPRHFERALRRFFDKVELERRDVAVILKICGQIDKFSRRPPPAIRAASE